MLDHGIVLIGPIHRYYWMARELSKMGLKTHIVDIPIERLRTSYDDLLGPWPIFHSDFVLPSQSAALREAAIVTPQTCGFTVWSENGPMELRGPLGRYQFSESGLSELVREYLCAAEGLSLQSYYESSQERVRSLPFEKTWLARLAHSFGACRESSFEEAFGRDWPLPLFAAVSRAVHTEGTLTGLLKKIRSMGHSVYEGQSNVMVELQNRRIVSLSLPGAQLNASCVLNFLTRSEFDFLFPETAQKVFKKKFEFPVWSWVRFSFFHKPHRLMSQIPRFSVWIKSLQDVWAYENLLVVDRVNEGECSVWLRVAGHRTDDKKYIGEIGEGTRCEMLRRIPGLQTIGFEMPRSLKSEGPISAFSSFEQQAAHGNLSHGLNNLWMAGPDSQTRQDFSGACDSQSKVLRNLFERLLEFSPRADEVSL